MLDTSVGVNGFAQLKYILNVDLRTYMRGLLTLSIFAYECLGCKHRHVRCTLLLEHIAANIYEDWTGFRR